MSGLINKVKEAVHSDKKDNAATNDPRSTNAGPHGSNMANTVDPRVDSDRDNLNQPGGVGGAGYGNQGAGIGGGPGHVGHGQHGGAAGVGSTGAGYGGPGNPQSGNAGPHSSNIANRADPRVDSDLDGGRNLGGAGGHGGAGYGSNTGVGGGYGGPGNPQSSNAGPHSSNFANKADPRVDSDLDGGRNFGAAGGHGATGGAGYGSNTGVGGGYGGPGNPQSSNAGPHSSNIANSADPRVDSDLDGGRHAGLGTSGVGHTSHTGHQGHPGHQGGVGGAGYGNQGAGVGGAGYGNQGAGVGGAGYGNQGAGVGGAGYDQSATPGTGNAQKTAGPHNSNLLNKLDPRVDSDMDGSKTYGGNQTHR